MTALRWMIGGLVAIAATAATAAVSRIPTRVYPSSESRLRVAFSARPERIESCRAVDAKELAELPQHMRQSVVCEGSSARYRLDVLRDDSLLTTYEVRGGGLRRDRQLYVLRELPLPSGRVAIEVRLSRVDSATSVSPEPVPDSLTGPAPTGMVASGDRESEARRRRIADEVPASLVLRETFILAPGEVVLVTYDQGARRLRAVRGGG